MIRDVHRARRSRHWFVGRWWVGVCLMLLGAKAVAGYEVLGSFQKPGTQVVASLVQHSDGDFYGAAAAGGAFGLGSVFKMTPTGVVSTLYAFAGADGSGPAAKLVEGADHALTARL